MAVEKRRCISYVGEGEGGAYSDASGKKTSFKCSRCFRQCSLSVVAMIDWKRKGVKLDCFRMCALAIRRQSFG